MTTFSWLHFTDLHAGQEGTEERWDPIRRKLHEDLKWLHEKMSCVSHKGWDAVFFTGDLAYRGSEADYQRVDAVLEPLWDLFKELGCDPVLIAVPGNHDVCQDNKDLVIRGMIKWDDQTAKEFWSDGVSRSPVKKAFHNYEEWYARWRQKHPPESRSSLRATKVTFHGGGIVPGDLSAVFSKDEMRIGVLGLNSAFLQLTDGSTLDKAGDDRKKHPFEGRLVLHPKQRKAVCPLPQWDDLPAIVLTHHPREWLRDPEEFETDVAPQGQFFLHCFGHMHEGWSNYVRVSGSEPARLAQGAALFGMEGDDRIHGYSGGALDRDGYGEPRLRIWPRFAPRPGGREYYIGPDWQHFELDHDDAVTESFRGTKIHFPRPTSKPKAHAEERPLVSKLLRAALSAASDPEPVEIDVERLIDLLAGKLKRNPNQGEASSLTELARLAVEVHLLEPRGEGFGSLQRVAADDFFTKDVNVSSRFFADVQDRSTSWRRYFEALEQAGLPVETLCRVHGKAFIAPQHLLAGLLARMEDDWSKVLDVYDRVAGDTEKALGRRSLGMKSGAFDRLQASQWICWLIWGPSIPACTCEAWDGLHALQLGYGDENYSLPVFNAGRSQQDAGLLGQLASGLQKSRVGALPVDFCGRLTWAPALVNDTDPARAAAQTQLALFDRKSDSLAVLLDSAVPTNESTRSYFTSYQWMMFLVGKSPLEPNGRPRLLRDNDFPTFLTPTTDMERFDLRSRRLWRNLVPVFVHANLADAEVFERQRAMLVRNSIELLRSLWRGREALFHSEDVKEGIRFFLVAASDYTGCGSELRYPLANPLADVLIKQLEHDEELRETIQVPRFSSGSEPWMHVAYYFSTCAMPDMVDMYYEYVAASRPKTVRPNPARPRTTRD